jgi:hypothetical protein
MYLTFTCLLSFFFFNFIHSQLIFVSDLVIILLIVVYLVLNHLSIFSQLHPFAFGFYIRFGPYFFDCDVFDFKFFIKLIYL